ncbi:MAG: hypothetical protein KatS3mg121_0066 [Gammaproteobacteria bacterium]|nr:MAG: hypothetical protein KatS3mg121_0066 [Gammaproteobacteria bacterium]
MVEQTDADTAGQRLEAELRAYVSANDRLRSAGMFDPELGVGSPEALAIELDWMHQLALRYQRVYALLLVDFDDYASYQAQYGRRAARLAHKLMAEHVRHGCRAADRLYRLDEGTALVVLLPETRLEGACVLGRRLVEGFRARGIPHLRSESRLLTLSAAAAAAEGETPPPEPRALLEEARLYLRVAQARGGANLASRLEAA